MFNRSQIFGLMRCLYCRMSFVLFLVNVQRISSRWCLVKEGNMQQKATFNRLRIPEEKIRREVRIDLAWMLLIDPVTLKPADSSQLHKNKHVIRDCMYSSCLCLHVSVCLCLYNWLLSTCSGFVWVIIFKWPFLFSGYRSTKPIT